MKKERLITEIASGVKMLELGLPARLSKDSLGMVDYWARELKEDPCLIDAIESEVNGALKITIRLMVRRCRACWGLTTAS